MMQSAPRYEDRPIRQTDFRIIAEVVQRFGLSPAAPEGARVLEIGCARGVNVTAMAARRPSASFVGIDIDAEAIATARRRAQIAGVTNVRFETVDVVDFEPEPGRFDYVIAHGILSWVPHRSADALLASIASALSSDGIAYVSYDTKPGACMRDALGLGLRASAHVQGALDLLEYAPALLGTHPGAWLRGEVEAARARPPSFVHHQFLGGVQRAFSVGEVWDWAERHGLFYVEDVADVGLEPDLVSETRARVERLTSSRRDAEQLLDVALMRQFRASLFARRPPGPPRPREVSVVVHESSVPARPRTLRLTQIEARELGFVSTPDLDARTLHPLHAVLIEHCDGVRDLRALADVVIAAVQRGALSLPSASGQPATLDEVRQGVTAVVRDALRDLARAGIVF